MRLTRSAWVTSAMAPAPTSSPSRRQVQRSATLKDLVELVRNEENRAIVLLQLLDDEEEIADLARRQRGGRLVHDDDVRVMRKRAGDFDQMLLRHAEILEQGAGVEVGVQALQHMARAGPHLEPVDAPAKRQRHVAHEDVLGDAELVEHHGFLVDRRYAGGPGVARSVAGERLAGDENLAFVRLVDAGEDLDQRRLARAVLADQRRHFARPQCETDIVQRAHAGKALGNARHRQDRRRGVDVLRRGRRTDSRHRVHISSSGREARARPGGSRGRRAPTIRRSWRTFRYSTCRR